MLETRLGLYQNTYHTSALQCHCQSDAPVLPLLLSVNQLLTSKMAVATRAAYSSPLFDKLSDLKGNQLPTYRDVLICTLWHKKRNKK